jgi:predicted TIM-barrel fold metal-dependent hydrolase
MSERQSTAIIDAHAHLGKWAYPITQHDAGGLAAEMSQLGISAAVVSHSMAIAYDAEEGNRVLAEEIRNYPQFWGYVGVNLNYLDEAMNELERYLGPNAEQPGKFIGVKVHQLFSRHSYDTPEGMALTRAVAGYGVPILVHTFGSPLESPWNVLSAAKANPNVRCRQSAVRLRRLVVYRLSYDRGTGGCRPVG